MKFEKLKKKTCKGLSRDEFVVISLNNSQETISDHANKITYSNYEILKTKAQEKSRQSHRGNVNSVYLLNRRKKDRERMMKRLLTAHDILYIL